MKKRSYSPEYKAKIVIEMLKEERHISEIAQREGISRTQLQNWKKEFLENAALVFSQNKVEQQARIAIKSAEEREETLMKKVGELSIEVDFLKKKYREIHGRDYWHTKQCYLGVRGLRNKLRKEDGLNIGRKLLKRYMEEMGIYAVYPKPNLSKPGKGHKKFPYLLKNKEIFLPNQVWAVDITYIKMGKKHMYLTAIIDWYSRFIVGWELSDTLETAPVLEAVKRAVQTYGYPAIINSDQGSQFTSDDYIQFMEKNKIRQSMDGKARWVDNVIIERWFRSLKCDFIYINELDTPKSLRNGIADYIAEYNHERPHTAHSGDYPAEAYLRTAA